MPNESSDVGESIWIHLVIITFFRTNKVRLTRRRAIKGSSHNKRGLVSLHEWLGKLFCKPKYLSAIKISHPWRVYEILKRRHNARVWTNKPTSLSGVYDGKHAWSGNSWNEAIFNAQTLAPSRSNEKKGPTTTRDPLSRANARVTVRAHRSFYEMPRVDFAGILFNDAGTLDCTLIIEIYCSQ